MTLASNAPGACVAGSLRPSKTDFDKRNKEKLAVVQSTLLEGECMVSTLGHPSPENENLEINCI